jgi:hypothetical protein
VGLREQAETRRGHERARGRYVMRGLDVISERQL